jgi:hypothetical protein
MAASITANPNPVGFWSPTEKHTTTISWNTDGAGNGYVRVLDTTVVGTGEQPFDTPKVGKHSKDYTTLELGHAYLFKLYRESNDKLLASVTVTTTDLEQQLLDQTTEWAMQERRMRPPAQEITDLTVAAGVDTVRITFNTVQATIPSVVVTTDDGATQVAAWLPLIGGPQTQHACTLGQNVPLDQQTQYRLRISVSGTNALGKHVDLVITRTFTTGSRKVTLFFDRINVSKDGDPGGAGEFKFYFYAGDASGGALLGYQLWGEGDISDDDPPVDVSRVIAIDRAPRTVYATVLGVDQDFDVIPYPGEGLPEYHPWVGFEGEGSWWKSTYDYDSAWVTTVFPIADVFGAGSRTFEMSTGEFGVAFTVFGRLMVEGRRGTTSATRKVRRGNRVGLPSHAVVATPGAFGAVGAAGGPGQVVGLSADGAIYSQAVGVHESRSRNEGWTRVADGVTGPVTVLASARDRIELFALDAAGKLSGATVLRGQPSKRWRDLGGPFVEPVAAVAGEDGTTDLFGLDEAGVTLHRSLGGGERTSKQDAWERIGEGVAGSVQALRLRRGGLAVFALGRDGTVLHKRREPPRWQPGSAQWQSLGRTSGTRLLVEPLDGDGVGLATVGDDGALEVLLWRNYPAGEPGRWKKHGTIESQLEADTGGAGWRRPDPAGRRPSRRANRSAGG